MRSKMYDIFHPATGDLKLLASKQFKQNEVMDEEGFTFEFDKEVTSVHAVVSRICGSANQQLGQTDGLVRKKMFDAISVQAADVIYKHSVDPTTGERRTYPTPDKVLDFGLKWNGGAYNLYIAPSEGTFSGDAYFDSIVTPKFMNQGMDIVGTNKAEYTTGQYQATAFRLGKSKGYAPFFFTKNKAKDINNYKSVAVPESYGFADSSTWMAGKQKGDVVFFGEVDGSGSIFLRPKMLGTIHPESCVVEPHFVDANGLAYSPSWNKFTTYKELYLTDGYKLLPSDLFNATITFDEYNIGIPGGTFSLIDFSGCLIRLKNGEEVVTGIISASALLTGVITDLYIPAGQSTYPSYTDYEIYVPFDFVGGKAKADDIPLPQYSFEAGTWILYSGGYDYSVSSEGIYGNAKSLRYADAFPFNNGALADIYCAKEYQHHPGQVMFPIGLLPISRLKNRDGSPGTFTLNAGDAATGYIGSFWPCWSASDDGGYTYFHNQRDTRSFKGEAKRTNDPKPSNQGSFVAYTSNSGLDYWTQSQFIEAIIVPNEEFGPIWKRRNVIKYFDGMWHYNSSGFAGPSNTSKLTQQFWDDFTGENWVAIPALTELDDAGVAKAFYSHQMQTNASAAFYEYSTTVANNTTEKMEITHILLDDYVKDLIIVLTTGFPIRASENSTVNINQEKVQCLLHQDKKSATVVIKPTPYINGYQIETELLPNDLPLHYCVGDENHLVYKIDVYGK